jgi:hypothetical protein
VAAVPRDRILYLKAPGGFDWKKIETQSSPRLNPISLVATFTP